jgi:hypothetical protein
MDEVIPAWTPLCHTRGKEAASSHLRISRADRDRFRADLLPKD